MIARLDREWNQDVPRRRRAAGIAALATVCAAAGGTAWIVARIAGNGPGGVAVVLAGTTDLAQRSLHDNVAAGRFVEGHDRRQGFLLPPSLDDYVTEDNPVRVIEAFIDELDLPALGFAGATPAATGRPFYHPSTMLKIYLYGYLNRVQSSRRLERQAQRSIELIWPTGTLALDFKTIANFRCDNGAAIRAVCRQFVMLYRNLGLFAQAVVAVDGSKFKAVNNRDHNYTAHKAAKRIEQVEASIDRYLAALDRPLRRRRSARRAWPACDRGAARELDRSNWDRSRHRIGAMLNIWLFPILPLENGCSLNARRISAQLAWLQG